MKLIFVKMIFPHCKLAPVRDRVYESFSDVRNAALIYLAIIETLTSNVPQTSKFLNIAKERKVKNKGRKFVLFLEFNSAHLPELKL